MAERTITTKIEVVGAGESIEQIKALSAAYEELYDVLRRVRDEMSKLGALLNGELI